MALTKNHTAAMSSCHHHHQPSSISIPRRSGSRKATLRRFSTPELHNNAHLSKTSASLKMVFEDEVRGVVCYRDGKGEVVCEGYDEGPRLGMRLPEKACFPWPLGIQITDFVELSALRVFDAADVLQF